MRNFLLIGATLVFVGCYTESPRSSREPVVALALPASDTAPTQPYIFISGEIKRPGLYSWTSGMTLTDAIDSAGGFTAVAGRSKIKVFHRDVSVSGRFDYDRIIEHKNADLVLKPGDKISVIGSLD